jgi:hypothetical protein
VGVGVSESMCRNGIGENRRSFLLPKDANDEINMNIQNTSFLTILILDQPYD